MLWTYPQIKKSLKSFMVIILPRPVGLWVRSYSSCRHKNCQWATKFDNCAGVKTYEGDDVAIVVPTNVGILVPGRHGDELCREISS